jgi:hypothetical protein
MSGHKRLAAKQSDVMDTRLLSGELEETRDLHFCRKNDARILSAFISKKPLWPRPRAEQIDLFNETITTENTTERARDSKKFLIRLRHWPNEPNPAGPIGQF